VWFMSLKNQQQTALSQEGDTISSWAFDGYAERETILRQPNDVDVQLENPENSVAKERNLFRPMIPMLKNPPKYQISQKVILILDSILSLSSFVGIPEPAGS
jgi:hypothetical protein